MSLEDSIKEMQEINRVYYRLYVGRDDKPCVVCMQWFDEYDYDQACFINEETYGTEEEAEAALLALKLRANAPLSTLERLKVARMLES